MAIVKNEYLTKRTLDFMEAFEKTGGNAKVGDIDLGKVDAIASMNHSLAHDQDVYMANYPVMSALDEGNAVDERFDAEFEKGGLFEGIQKPEIEHGDSFRSAFEKVDCDEIRKKYPEIKDGEDLYDTFIAKRAAELTGNEHSGADFDCYMGYDMQQDCMIDFINVQKELVREELKDTKSPEYIENLEAALDFQYRSDFETGEYLGYARDVIGYMPCGRDFDYNKYATEDNGLLSYKEDVEYMQSRRGTPWVKDDMEDDFSKAVADITENTKTNSEQL